MYRTVSILLALGVAVLCGCESPFQAFVLSDQQNPCTIVMDFSPYDSFEAALQAKNELTGAGRRSLRAAQELRLYLASMMNVPERQISVMDDDHAIDGRILLVGLPGEHSAYQDARKKLLKLWRRMETHHRGSIRLDAWSKDNRQILALTSQQPSTVLDAVYVFLEKQGVVWYAPGERDVYVPTQHQICMLHAAVIEEPALVMRGFFPGCPDQGKHAHDEQTWMTWWLRQHVKEIPAEWSTDSALLQEFGMQAVKSSRQIQPQGWQPGFCAANTAALHELGKNIWPAFATASTYVLDGQQVMPLCTCAACQALGNESSRLAAILNILGHDLAEAQNNGTVARNCRLVGVVPITAPDQPLPRNWPAAQVTLAIQMLPRCYNHSIDDVSCTEVNVPLRLSLAAWHRQAADVDLAVVEGYYASDFAGLPLVLDHVLNTDMAAYQALGIRGIYCDAPRRSMPGMQGYLNFIFCQSGWNGRLPVDSLREDFFSAHYPGVSSAVMEYYAMAEEAMANITAWRYVMTRRIEELKEGGFSGVLLPLPGYKEHFNLYQNFAEHNDGVDWERTFQLIHDMRHVMDELLDKNLPDHTFDRLMKLEKQLQFADLTIVLYDNVIRSLTLGADEPEMREESAIRLRQVVKKMTEFELEEDACGRTTAFEQSGISDACKALLAKLEQEFGAPYQRVYEE